MSEERTSYIITFKAKDKRSDKKSDKAEIFLSATKSKVEFLDSGTLEAMPHRPEIENIGLDINEYEAPILAAPLTKEQVAALKRDPNVERVEEDGKCYALY